MNNPRKEDVELILLGDISIFMEKPFEENFHFNEDASSNSIFNTFEKYIDNLEKNYVNCKAGSLLFGLKFYLICNFISLLEWFEQKIKFQTDANKRELLLNLLINAGARNL